MGFIKKTFWFIVTSYGEFLLKFGIAVSLFWIILYILLIVFGLDVRPNDRDLW